MKLNFLEEVVQYKKELLKEKKISLSDLKKAVTERADTAPGLLKDALVKPGISLIAEIKMSSPSSGSVSRYPVKELAQIYDLNGVDCISVITEDKYFKGSIKNIELVKSVFGGPVLMKDFIISEYQIYEAVDAGADGVLLIAAILSKVELREFLNLCEELKISPVVEVHSEDEIDRCIKMDKIEIIGVNIRNLRTLKLNPEIAERLIKKIPEGIVKIAESGINSFERVKELYNMGYDAVLVGRSIASSDSPEKLIKQMKLL